MSLKRSLLVVALLAVSGGLWAYHQHGVSIASDQQPKDGGEELAKLAKVRRDAAEKAFKASLGNDRSTQSALPYHLSLSWLHAELELVDQKEHRIAAYAAHSKRMKEWEADWEFFFKVTPGHPYQLVMFACQKEAAYWLAKERAGK